MPSPDRAARKRHRFKRQHDNTHPITPALNDDGLPMAPMTWAERLQRVFRIDITTCPECGGQLRRIAG